MANSTFNKILFAVGAIWLVASASGFAFLAAYEGRPGQSAVSVPHWPEGAALSGPHGRPLLVLFAHPYCPCTNATVGELDRLMARCHGHLDAIVAFVRPPGMPVDWEKTALWRSAAAIPDVRVITDADGREAARFGAATSGQALLYSADGKLLFDGGITGSRGHAGDNDGSDAVAILVGHGQPAISRTPVYGCSIFSPGMQLTGVERCKR